MNAFTQDLRYAIRALLATPGFSIVAILSLAIGIGANTAIFSVANALLLRPLPYKNAERQVILWNTSPGLGITEDWFSTAQYFDIRTLQRSFEDVAIAIGANSNLTGDGEPERVGTIRVSSNLLPMLGAQPLLGQMFGADDDRPGKTGKAILGFATWMRRYGGDRNVVGRSLTLNGQPYEIVGVLPRSFSLPREVMPTLGVVDDAEVVLPLPLAANAAEVPQSRGLQHHRDAEAWRHHCPGQGRTGHPHGEAAPGASRLLSAERRPGVPRVAASGTDRRPRASRAHRPCGIGRVRAADRVRQRRQPPAVAGTRAAARSRRPFCARRQPVADRSSAAHRKPPAGDLRRTRRIAGVALLPAGDSRPRRSERAAPRRDRDGLAGAALHDGRRHSSRACCSAWRRHCGCRRWISRAT